MRGELTGLNMCDFKRVCLLCLRCNAHLQRQYSLNKRKIISFLCSQKRFLKEHLPLYNPVCRFLEKTVFLMSCN